MKIIIKMLLKFHLAQICLLQIELKTIKIKSCLTLLIFHLKVETNNKYLPKSHIFIIFGEIHP